MRVGVFDIEPDPTKLGRWLVTNTLTTFTHRTYGVTWEEVESQAIKASVAWARRVKEDGGTAVKAGFRKTNFDAAGRAKAAKAKEAKEAPG